MRRFSVWHSPVFMCVRRGDKMGICHHLDIGTKNQQFLENLKLATPFNDRASQYIGSPFFGNKSPAARTRDLFKPSTDSTILLLDILTSKKNVFRFWFGVYWGERHKWECFCIFLATLTWPWAPTHWPILLAQVFSETRQKSASLEPSNGFYL